MDVNSKIVEYSHRKLATFLDFFHSSFNAFVLVVNLILKNFPISISLCNPKVELLKDIQFIVRIKNGVLEFINFFCSFDSFCPYLIN